MHWEAALSRPSHYFKAGASERSPPLWSGINAALMLQGDADRFTWEAPRRQGRGVGSARAVSHGRGGRIGFEPFQV